MYAGDATAEGDPDAWIETTFAIQNKNLQGGSSVTPDVIAATGWGHPDNTTEINGGVIHTDSIFADSIWLDDSLEINSGGDIFSGKATAASTTTGFFLGVEENVPKFNVGDGTKYMRWLGSTLEVGGEIVATENIEDNAVTSTSSYYIDGEITLSTTYQTIISAPSAIMGVTSGDQVLIWFNAIQSAGERNSPDITYRLYVGGELEYTSWPMKDYKSFVVVITAPSTGNLALSVQAISAATDTTYTQYAALRNRAVLALVTRK